MSKYAIVIGIDHYVPPEKSGLKTLKGAIADAKEVHKWLISYGGVPEDNCFLYTSTEQPLAPAKTVIDKKIVDIIKDIQENHQSDADRLYFYYAGHGLCVPDDMENTGMCMADWEEYMADVCSISSSQYKKKFINEGLFKEIILWMDCCRTAKFQFDPGRGPRILPRMGPNHNPRWMVAFGAQFNNEAFEAVVDPANNEMRGVFTKVLLEGLTGAAPSAGVRPNVAELSNYLYYKVPLEAQKAGFSQDPEIFGNTHTGKPVYF
ncbi:MAG: caspase family protein [Candidatus Pseudobacter hemicellulosilyticus]|uniref:Caspase family protein n=1 Tax=Candidatus Pseudobacter hemicellulosilyticus TaxID=3121375 RepID=A0AAJ5WPV8_9BACT|nr:MAG: caspase family protein [Pseudobacter sp.]